MKGNQGKEKPLKPLFKNFFWIHFLLGKLSSFPGLSLNQTFNPGKNPIDKNRLGTAPTTPGPSPLRSDKTKNENSGSEDEKKQGAIMPVKDVSKKCEFPVGNIK